MTESRTTDGLVWHGQRTTFTQIPDWLLTHPDIGADALRTWLIIASYANKDLSAFPGVRTIAERSNRHRASIFRHLDELEQAGALRRQQRYRNDGGRTSTLYTLAWDFPLNTDTYLHTPPSHKRDGGVRRTNATGVRRTNETGPRRDSATPRTTTKTNNNPLPPRDIAQAPTIQLTPQGGDPPATPPTPSSSRSSRRSPRALGTNPRAVAAQEEVLAKQTRALDAAHQYGDRMARIENPDSTADFQTMLYDELKRGSGWLTEETIAAAVTAYAGALAATGTIETGT